MARRWAMVIAHVAAPPMAWVEPRGRPPHFEEDFLGYLLGLGRIPKNSADHAVDRADQPVVQRLKRFVVATCYVDKQVIEVPLSPPIRSRGLEPGGVRIARAHMSPSKQTPDRMGGTWRIFNYLIPQSGAAEESRRNLRDRRYLLARMGRVIVPVTM